MMKQLQNKLPSGLPQFAIVGTVGFIVDALILNLLIFEFDWGYYTARIASFGIALPCTWILNRIWTFRHQASANRTIEYSLYAVIQTTGALLNFAIYSRLIYVSDFAKQYPIIPLAIASLCAMLFNFFAARRFAFTGSTPATNPSESDR